MWHACLIISDTMYMNVVSMFTACNLDMNVTFLYAVMCSMLHFSYLNAFSGVLPRRIQTIKVLLYVCMHVCMYVFLYVCTYICMYVGTDMYISMDIRTHTYIHTYASTYEVIIIPYQLFDIYTILLLFLV